MDHDHLFVYERHYKNQQWLVIANFSASAVDLPEGLARRLCCDSNRHSGK